MAAGRLAVGRRKRSVAAPAGRYPAGMPADTFRHTVTVPALSATVRTALQEAETWAGIGPIDEVWAADHDDGGNLTGFRWSARAAGRRWEGAARLVETNRPHSMTLGLRTDEMAGSITCRLTPDHEGTTLSVVLRAEATGMTATLFWGVIATAIGRGFPVQVEAFGRRFSAT